MADLVEITLGGLIHDLEAARQRMGRKNSHRSLIGQTIQILVGLAHRVAELESANPQAPLINPFTALTPPTVATGEPSTPGDPGHAEAPPRPL